MPSEDQLKEVAKQKQLDGSKVWNDAGRFGIRNGVAVPIWVTEGNTDHATSVCNRIKDITSPDNIFQSSLAETNNPPSYGTTYQGRYYSAEEFIVEKGIQVITRSIGGPANSGQPESAFWNNLKEKYNLIFFNSAGNDGYEYDGDSLDCSFPSDVALYITGMTSSAFATYSSCGDEVDFCDYVGFLNGTSFAAPYTAAKARLLKALYGFDMTQDEITKYFIMCAVDMVNANIPGMTVGDDIRTGHGKIILPAPSKRYIRMQVDNTVYSVDGVSYTMDTVPVNQEGTVFVPIRAVAEGLGKTVTWDEPTKTATITDGATTITLILASTIMRKNGAAIILNFAPYRDANGRTMVPVRAISEAFGCKVDWVQAKKRVMILEQ